ncbi:Uncharacterised protein [Vibrio cholerae]|uniref:Uncharacterized protein n=1 Tax=Vibrio cholerae TaxID=666 RepID=A0A655S705_VIBCL|nr:Uncharacterised protein [Vibrio cholerae]CSB73650.1 Uncharacterised protein [Vibrio cholerae]CSB95006.1 Uncharacterised protein [Vibrio cholerae]CSC21648.1 Uncharacterised protein [Vibrio cholerae]CSC69138.1 Uncharacterised protein [Vibrio cholerae]
MEIEPTLASVEGSSAIPLPIMLPATTPVQAIRPIFFAFDDITSPNRFYLSYKTQTEWVSEMS